MPDVRDVLQALAASTADYDKIVDSHGLRILKSPGDILTENGGIALTKDGRSLKFGDTAYNALFRFVSAWRLNVPMFKLLFDLVYEAKRKEEELEHRKSREFPSFGAIMGKADARNSYYQIDDEIGATQMAYRAAATALLLAISSMLGLFKIDVEAGPEWKTSGPLFGGYSFGAVIEATANNFRHRDEWAMTQPPDARQLSSIRILAAALNESISTDGSRNRLSRDIGHEMLEILSEGNFETFAARIFRFANALAEWRRTAM